MSEHRLWKAHQLIAMDARFLFEALFQPDANLCTETVMLRVNGCAYHGREPRIDQRLSTYDDEDTLFAWIAAPGFLYQV